MKAEKIRLMVRKIAITMMMVSTSLLGLVHHRAGEDLEDLGIGDGGAERAALDQVEILAGELRHHDAQRLRQHDQEEHAALDEPERAGRLVLALRHRLDRAAHDLGDEGGDVDRQPGPQRRELGRHLGAAGDVEAGQRRELDVLDPGGEQPDRDDRQEQRLRARGAALQRQPPDERRRDQQDARQARAAACSPSRITASGT